MILSRRRYLVAGGVLVSVGGCVGDDEEPLATDDDDTVADDEEVDDDDDEPDETDDDSADDADPEETDDDTADDDPDPDDDDTADDDTGEPIGEIFRASDAYEISAVVDIEGERTEISGRVVGGDVYWSYTVDGEPMEWYLVDGTTYMVADGDCFMGTFEEDPESVDPDEYETEVEEHPEVEPVGEDEIDGESVLVYEFTDEEETIRYYVLADSGYLRRVAGEEWTVDFLAWGDDVEAIEPPDMECEEMPEAPEEA